ncbi:hypothetical protein SCOR_04650 [Sulfidibacter corallicola]|uniref:Uncharacterized protein n=1 Tax=Sulfidibacter corallicola TaxID=2818388 RepID=A0A8A4TPN6_SULCO|nr:hypothetical protein [Sulfidibacter corallicola]QTD51936.1 hypothetical protein J3U87_05640 [Sulfidibacter corallicola]
MKKIRFTLLLLAFSMVLPFAFSAQAATSQSKAAQADPACVTNCIKACMDLYRNDPDMLNACGIGCLIGCEIRD